MKSPFSFLVKNEKAEWRQELGLRAVLAWDFGRSFFEPVMAYRLGYLVVVKRRYRRPWPTRLQDGTILRRGDKIVRLHMKLFLPRFRGDATELAYSRFLYHLLKPELPWLAALLRNDPAWADFVALTGQSHIVGWFTEQAGFETLPIPDLWRLMVDFLGRGAMLLSDPSPRCLAKIIQPAGVRPPRECWASRESFLTFYPAVSGSGDGPKPRRLFRYF